MQSTIAAVTFLALCVFWCSTVVSGALPASECCPGGLLEYSGSANTTANGTACLEWWAFASTRRSGNVLYWPGSGAADPPLEANFCRSENHDQPWCFVTTSGEGTDLWDNCGISCVDATPQCGGACADEVCHCGVCYETKTYFGECSTSCGEGTQDLVVGCFAVGDDELVDDVFCGNVSDPSFTPASQACNTTCGWEVGANSTCSVTCGRGVVTRELECVQHGGVVAADEVCVNAGLPKPDPFVEECDVDVPCLEENCLEADQSDYVGNVATTKSGRACDYWDKRGFYFSSSSVSGAGDFAELRGHNYCRNPDPTESNTTKAWCFVANAEKYVTNTTVSGTDMDVVWEECDIRAPLDYCTLNSVECGSDARCEPRNGVCYKWIYTYGACNDTASECGESTMEELTVTCYDFDPSDNSTGSVQDDVLCPGGTKPALGDAACDLPSCTVQDSACASTGLCVKYNVSAFGSCDVVCGESNRTRSVTCFEVSSDAVVADSECDSASLVRPSETESCDVGGCDNCTAGERCSCEANHCRVYEWRVGAFGSCSETQCGNQTETAECWLKSIDGNVSETAQAGAGDCDGLAQPALDTRACNNDTCVADSTCADGYFGACVLFEPGEWSACNVSCGTGVQTRSVGCADASTNATVDLSVCRGTELAEPASSQSCMEECPSCEEGTACACVGGECHVYEWRAGDFGACSESECGVETQVVECWEANGGVVVTGGECDSLTPPSGASRACNNASCAEGSTCGDGVVGSCVKYLAGNWSACGVYCGEGERTREVECVKTSDESVVDVGACSSLSALNTTEACSESCPEGQGECDEDNQCRLYEWVLGGFGACSDAVCGTEQRDVTCMVSVNGTSAIEASNATKCGAEPDRSPRACNNGTCAADSTCSSELMGACVTYTSSGEWSACNVSCGTGMESSGAVCERTDTNVTVDLSVCQATALADPGLVYRECTDECPACGAGTACACAGGECHVYEWRVGDFGACSESECGVETQVVECWEANGDVVVTGGECDSLTPPSVASRACNNASCAEGSTCADGVAGSCVKYLAGNWSACDVYCGAGERTREVECVRTSDESVVDVGACSSLSALNTTEACSESCPEGQGECGEDNQCRLFEWSLGGYGACSDAVCGTELRDVTCMVSVNGTTATEESDATKCGAEPDRSPRACNNGTCAADSTCSSELMGACVSYESDGEWSACNVSCGTGMESSGVECQRTDTNATVDLSVCQATALADPGLVYRECTDECPACEEGTACACVGGECHVYEWRVGDFGACSESECGVETQVVECWEANGDVMVTGGECDSLTPPSVASRACNNASCAEGSTCADGVAGSCVKYLAGSWSACDVYCGAGERTREVECVKTSDKSVVDVGACSSLSALNTTEVCSESCPEGQGECGEDNQCWLYTWSVGAYGPCSDPVCGTEQRDVTCMVSVNGTAATEESDATKCGAEPDRSPRACNTDQCLDGASCGTTSPACDCSADRAGARCQYAWVFSDDAWSACSVTCGEGTQTRPPSCMDQIDGSATDESNCVSKPADEQRACTIECPTCNATSCGAHGACVDETCTCTDGYSGSACDEAPSVSLVTSTFTAITLQRTSQASSSVEWSSSAGVASVAVLLMRGSGCRGASKFCPPVRTLATDVTSQTVSLSWPQMGDINVGTDYFLRVQFSPSVFADSPMFDVQGDCLVDDDCGTHGTCSSTGVCVCDASHAGAQCETELQDTCGFECVHGSVDAACTGCTCVPANRWQGGLCNECKLSCGANGATNSECTQCVCSSGFFGSTCQNEVKARKQVRFELDYDDAMSDEEATKESIRSDLRRGLSASASELDVLELRKGSVIAILAIGGSNPDTLAETLDGLIKDRTSVLYSGSSIVASRLDSEFGVQEAPAERDTDSSESEPLPLELVAAAGIVCLLLFAGVLVFMRRRRKRHNEVVRFHAGSASEVMAPSRGANMSVSMSHSELGLQIMPSSSNANLDVVGDPTAAAAAMRPVPIPEQHSLAVPESGESSAGETDDDQPGSGRPTPEPLPPLPEGWVRYETDGGVPYYANAELDQVVWELAQIEVIQRSLARA